jgi:Flp pilus assembly protein TadG
MALAIPLLALLALVLVQVGLIVRDQVLVVHAAREAVREVAVGGTAAEAAMAGSRASSLKRTMLTVDINGRRELGSRVTATVTYRAETDVPLAGRLIPSVELRASATMRVEKHGA